MNSHSIQNKVTNKSFTKGVMTKVLACGFEVSVFEL